MPVEGGADFRAALLPHVAIVAPPMLRHLAALVPARFLGFCAGGVLLLSTGCSRPSSEPEKTQAARVDHVFRIARNKQLTALGALEQLGGLERALGPVGFRVEWLEFLAGPQQLEAINAGALDLALTAESPPLFAQAADGPVAYLATMAPNGSLVSLLVPPKSPVKTVADLKGKRVAFQKASIGHYLLVKALADVGLDISAVQQVYLPPPDANAALSQSTVDAWFIWEPFVTRAVQNGTGRVILDGSKLRDTTNFYTTTQAFAKEHPEVLRIFLDVLCKEEDWSQSHRAELVQLLAPKILIDASTLGIMYDKTKFGVFQITPHDRQKQQEVADMWFSLGLFPKKVDVSRGFLSAEQYGAIAPPGLLAIGPSE
jgi:sulfonate transport system substrate-binding protein